MKVLIPPLVGFSLILSSCNGVNRPDTDVCLINSLSLHEICYNLLRDYNDDGSLKPDAKPKVKQYPDAASMLAGLNKGIRTDPDGWAHLKAYIQELREMQSLDEQLENQTK